MTKQILTSLVIGTIIFGTQVQAATEQGLFAHWKLQADAKDSSGKGNHGTIKNITFADGAAVFNGRDGWIEVPDAESLHFGKKDFSVSVWVKPEVPMRNVFGDILSKFDGAKRRGLNFHIAGSSSGYTSMCDTRHVHFGMDDAYLGEWSDLGKPEISNSLITDLVVFEGQLYAGIADAKNPQDACRVFRYGGGSKWIDCGRLGDDPNHLTVQSLYVHAGKLYAGTGIWKKQRAWGTEAGKAAAAKPHVFVYEGGTKWRDLGQVGAATRVMTMGSFNGELYVGLDKFTRGRTVLPGKCFKYTATGWVDCGAPDGQNFENLLPLGGTLYGATHGSMFRYQGGTNWTCIGKLPYNINQVHSLDVYRGQLQAGTWPQGYALGYEGGDKWSITGRLGLPEAKPGEKEVNEINDLIVHNGKMYAGVIPMAEVYRYEDGGKWTLLKSLGHQPTLSRTNYSTWCRVTAMASYQGKLFAGTGSCGGLTDECDPDGTLGRIYTIQAGQIASHEHDIGGGWTHLAAVRRGKDLQLFVNGKLSATTAAPEGRIFDVSNTEVLKIGFGAQNYFTGGMSDLRLYSRALEEKEVKQLLAERPGHK